MQLMEDIVSRLEKKTPLAPSERFVLLILAMNADADTGEVSLSVKEIEAKTGLAKPTVSRAMRLMKAKGIIDRHRQWARPTKTTLRLDEIEAMLRDKGGR